MAIRTELTLRLQNSPGTLARVCQVIADERMNIVAMNLASPLVVRLVVDNPVHAAAMLREHHYQVEERDVIYTTTANDPGALLRIARLIAEAGINVEYPVRFGARGAADGQRRGWSARRGAGIGGCGRLTRSLPPFL